MILALDKKKLTKVDCTDFDEQELLCKLLVFILEAPGSETNESDLEKFFFESGFDVVDAGISLDQASNNDWAVRAVVCYNTRLDLTNGINGTADYSLFKLHRQLEKKFGSVTYCCQLLYGETAMRLIDNEFGKVKKEIFQKIADKYSRYEPTQLRLRRLDGNNQRSRVDLIAREGKKYVRKLFYDGYEAYFQSELFARTNLSDPAVSEIIEADRNFFIMPFYENSVKWEPDSWGYFPLDKAREVMEVVARLNARGHALVDWHPATMIFDPKHGMKIVDFEFSRECRPEADFTKSADSLGEYGEGKEQRRKLRKGGYNHFWKHAVGLEYGDLMTADTKAAKRKQAVHFVTRKLPKKFGSMAQKAINAVRRIAWRARHNVNAGHISGDRSQSIFRDMLLKQAVQDKRIALIQSHDEYIIDALRHAGVKEILSLSAKHDEPLERNASGLVLGRYNSSSDVRSNNAEVLFLGGSAPWAARRFKAIGHAQYLCVPLSPLLIAFLPGWLRYRSRGMLQYQGMITLPAIKTFRRGWLLFKNRHKKHMRGPRYYVDALLKPKEIFARLEGLNYILLRWPEQLDQLDQLTDLDMLVSDSDLTAFIARLDQTIGTRPVDLYTETGHNNHGWDGIAYYPPHMARSLLKEVVVGPHGARIAKPDHAYLAFAYHLLFHKNPAVRSPDYSIRAETWAVPRYYEELCRLATVAGRPVARTLGELEKALDEAGWLPPPDCISVYGKTNPYIRATHNKQVAPPGLSVFIFREVAERYNYIERMEKEICEGGFEILESVGIAVEDRAKISAATRGSNWSSPRDREDEGGPAHFVIAYDPAPIKLKERKLRKRYPRIDNARCLIKREIRKKLAKEMGVAEKQFNPLHASDNSTEALDYISVIRPDLLQASKRKLGLE